MVQRDSGAEFAIGYDILELVEPELLVLRSDPMPEMGMHEPTITRVELHDIGGRTRMTLTDGPYPETGHPAGACPLRPCLAAVSVRGRMSVPCSRRLMTELGLL